MTMSQSRRNHGVVPALRVKGRANEHTKLSHSRKDSQSSEIWQASSVESGSPGAVSVPEEPARNESSASDSGDHRLHSQVKLTGVNLTHSGNEIHIVRMIDAMRKLRVEA